MLARGTTARSKKAISNCVLTFTRRTCPATLYGESPPKIAGTAVQEAALGRPGESLKDARQAHIAHPPTRILPFERQLIYGQSARSVLRAHSANRQRNLGGSSDLSLPPLETVHTPRW
jgi:hypothetical protein